MSMLVACGQMRERQECTDTLPSVPFEKRRRVTARSEQERSREDPALEATESRRANLKHVAKQSVKPTVKVRRCAITKVEHFQRSPQVQTLKDKGPPELEAPASPENGGGTFSHPYADSERCLQRLTRPQASGRCGAPRRPGWTWSGIRV
eukprot:2910809-Amphidinium_carterae.1